MHPPPSSSSPPSPSPPPPPRIPPFRLPSLPAPLQLQRFSSPPPSRPPRRPPPWLPPPPLPTGVNPEWFESTNLGWVRLPSGKRCYFTHIPKDKILRNYICIMDAFGMHVGDECQEILVW